MSDVRHEDYWEGGTLEYHSTIDNGGGGGGTVAVEITPGAGNEFEVIGVRVVNTGVGAESVLIRVSTDSSAEVLMELVSGSTAAASFRQWPHGTVIADDNAMAGGRLIVSGEMILRMAVAAADAGQGGEFALIARLRGGMPTITEAGNSTPTITINKEQIA